MRRSALCLGLLIALGCKGQGGADLPVVTELPEFSLVDHDGRAFQRGEMQGELWVADFIFTHCRSTCPRLTAHMRGLQERVSDVQDANFLSVSVDPRNDTPEVLKAYVEKNELKDGNWRFVTGEEEAIKDVVLRGFRVGMGENPGSTAQGDEMMHANHFVLVDRDANVRGYYRANNDGIGDLERDLRALASTRPSVD